MDAVVVALALLLPLLVIAVWFRATLPRGSRVQVSINGLPFSGTGAGRTCAIVALVLLAIAFVSFLATFEAQTTQARNLCLAVFVACLGAEAALSALSNHLGRKGPGNNSEGSTSEALVQARALPPAGAASEPSASNLSRVTAASRAQESPQDDRPRDHSGATIGITAIALAIPLVLPAGTDPVVSTLLALAIPVLMTLLALWWLGRSRRG